jgi:hypothetical protein
VAARLICLVVAGMVATACVGATDEPSAQGPVTPPPVTVTAAISAAKAALDSKLAPAGFTLTETFGYDPGRPAGLQTTPRATFQLNLVDPNQGFVVIFDLGTPDAALAAGADFATYLQKSGHSNYPADAEFTLNVVDSALIFHWWSRERSNEPDRAAQAFDIISSVGQRVTVIN